MNNWYTKPKRNWYDRTTPVNSPRSPATQQMLSMPENAQQINEFPDYCITPDGTIYNRRGGIIASSPDTKGYLKVGLYKDGQRYTRRVHVLVALQFLPIPEGLGKNPVVDHIDQDRTHCSVDNLQWVSQAENIAKAYEQGRVQSTAIAVRCIEDDKTFFSCTQAAKHYNISKITVHDALEKRNGYVKRINRHFEYVD